MREKLKDFHFSIQAIALVAFFIIGMAFVPLVRAGNDDSNPKEVGVEWVNIYHGHGGDLTWNDSEAGGFYDRLGELGWTKRFNFGNDSAMESDFEKPAVKGYDNIWIDTLDFAYFAGHGSPYAFYFGTDHDHEDGYTYRVHYSEAEWGDEDLEWIVLAGCQILQKEGVFDRWGWPVFKGLHAILGFDSTEEDKPIWILYPIWWESPGKRFVDYMTHPYTIKESWKRTTIDWQDSDVWGAALGVKNPSTGHIQYNDYLPGYGYVSSDIDNPTVLAHARWQC
jgi:hypothetical protein